MRSEAGDAGWLCLHVLHAACMLSKVIEVCGDDAVIVNFGVLFVLSLAACVSHCDAWDMMLRGCQVVACDIHRSLGDAVRHVRFVHVRKAAIPAGFSSPAPRWQIE